ncbi:nuclear pore complex protein Nup205-like isoform X2 [Halichondria panicea]|uniref:nuclear pore complex protein Nup205-like isoform X2 n=1 Tax=Halichondria panicea TaxID=6063 RepID=UPI00312B717D
MSAGGVWAPYKELAGTVNAAIVGKQDNVYYSLEAVLQKHKPDFISLLKNPPKNVSDRQLVLKSVKDGLSLPTLPNLHTLPQDFIDEALILSDILDLNEVSSVELLVAGEQQLPRFPNLTRGLVAVLLYYDGRRSLVSALRTLVQAREGVCWTLDLPPHTSHFVTSFTNDLMIFDKGTGEGIVDRILSLLDTITVTTELERLSKGRAIGDPKHKARLVYFIEEIRTALADCLLYWAIQNPFNEGNSLKLIRYLSKVTLDTPGMREAAKVSATPLEKSQKFASAESTDCILFHALLACFNIGEITPESAVDESMLDDHYPALSATFVPSIHAELLKGDWSTPELHSAVMFAWAVLLRECSSRASFAGVTELEDDGAIMDIHLGPALVFTRQSILTCPHFLEEEHLVKILHHQLTSFIIHYPLKIKEVRNQGDEIARVNSDLVLPSKRVCEELMKLIGDLYSHDPHDLQLSLEFWSPTTDHTHQTPGLHHRVPQRQISLYKFISTCSDLLPAPLFPALMHMLVGLASSTHSAHHTFNYLKANSPSLGGGGASAAISLEHFFLSLKQYYLELKKEGGSRATPTGSPITPLELDGLRGVLSLIRIIAKYDENARIVMYENQSWLPVASLFGLVGCPVPRELKADVLETLAVFARTPEIAASMWHTLEVAQILTTSHAKVPTHDSRAFGHHGNQDGGIQVELDELESQIEEYCLTRAFLSLLNALIDVPPPPGLGAGHRVPGFDPYLEFVRDNVFLRFDSRGYRNAEEKWQVASLALEILHKLLLSYEVSPEDFVNQYYDTPEMGGAMVPKQPGHTLLLHMLNDSKLLRKIRSVIDTAYLHLSDPGTTSPEALAHTALLCLKMLETAFSKESSFLDQLRNTHDHGIITSPLNELLGSINSRTGKADFIVTIARYATLTECSPELSLTAVQILTWVCQSHLSGSQTVNHILSDKDVCSEILQGFVEQLEMEVEGQLPTEGDPLSSVAGVHQAVKLGILTLLSLCVDHPPPNITHLLLGYETSSEKSVSDTNLQDPGVMGAPRTCLHSILSLLEHGQDSGCHYSNPKLAELCYKVIYQLCASRHLSTPTLRYLRSNHEFFSSQLSKLPLNVSILQDENDDGVLNSQQVAVLHEEAWLIKTLAVELRMTTLNHQRSHAQRIVNLLLNEPTNENAEIDHTTDYGEQSSDFNFLHEKKRKILLLLDSVDFSEKDTPTFDLQFFDQSAMEEAIKSCEAKEEVSGGGYTDVKALHRLLMMELNMLQGTGAAGQRQSVLEEIHEILVVVVMRNRVFDCNHGNSELFESWRQLVEVALHSLGQVGVKSEVKVAVLFELIQDLLLKVSGSDSSELTSSVQGVVLMLLSHLRQTLATPTENQDDGSDGLSSLYVGPLHAILKGLVDNLLRSPSSNQKARAYLSGALLYYLVLTKRQKERQGKQASLWRTDKEEDTLSSGNLSVLSSFGESFMDMVAKNACSWHAVSRMLSLSLLDAIVALDYPSVWLRFLSSKGYLQNLCASVLWEDEALVKMTTPTPETLRALYVYESKMAFLTRVAKDAYGGRELVTLNAVNYLSQCKFIDNRPSYHDNAGYYGNSQSIGQDGFVPSVSDRYRQAFLPLLKFLLALLTSPGAHHKEACAQVTDLIGSHSEIFATVLKEQHQVVTMATLQELALVTAVIGHSDVGHDWSSQMATPIGSGLVRLQRLMLTLLPQYWSKQNWKSLVNQVTQSEGGDGVRGVDLMINEDASLVVQQIATNLVSYCRVAMTIGGTEFSSPYCRILLTPHLAEAITMPSSRATFAPMSGAHPHSLGLLIQHLKECVDGYGSSLETHQQKNRKLESGTLGMEDVRTLLPANMTVDKLSPAQQQTVARQRLKQLVTNRKQELQHYAYLIENLLYLLWRHLQYYLVHCKPVTSDPQMVGMARSSMRRLQEYGATQSGDLTFDLSSVGEGVSAADLESLKIDIGKSLTDGLFKKLLDVEEAQFSARVELRVGFVQALVRRVRRLLKLKADVRTDI